MARLGSFDETQFARLDPRMLRVRVAVPAEFALDAGATRLTTAVRFGSEQRRDNFGLEQVSLAPSSRKGGLFSGDVAVASYELRLSEASLSEFRKMQELARPGSVKEVDMNVEVSLAKGPRDATQLQVWVDLLRSLDEGWFTLIDGGTIDIGKTTRYGEKR
jgi:hypothetical protein